MGIIIKKTNAFTLIEVMVVIGILSIILPIVITIIFTITNQQLKIQKLSLVKREGDFAVNVMKGIIRNYGSRLYKEDPTIPANEVCSPSILGSFSSTTSGSDFYIKDKNNNNIRFYLDVTPTGNRIASESSAMILNPTTLLTSSNMHIESYEIGCTRTNRYSNSVISISFTICYKNKTLNDCTMVSSRAEEQPISLNYQTKIKLRN